MSEYTVLYCDTPRKLALEVEQHVAHGWKLQGGVSVVFGGSEYPDIWAQALTKPESQDDGGKGQ